jgi:hypothetical protein
MTLINWGAILPHCADTEAYAARLEAIESGAWLALCCMREGY